MSGSRALHVVRSHEHLRKVQSTFFSGTQAEMLPHQIGEQLHKLRARDMPEADKDCR